MKCPSDISADFADCAQHMNKKGHFTRMDKLKQHAPTLIFAGFIAVSLLVGCFLPAFYAWTGTGQSRPSPLIWQVPLLAAVVAAAFCAALIRLPIIGDSNHDSTSIEPSASARYCLRRLLLVTTGVGIAMAVLVKYPLVGCLFVNASLAAFFIRFWRKYPRHRLAAIALVACMYLPFVWAVGYKQILPMVFFRIGVLPTFLPAAWSSSLAGLNFRESPGMGFLLTALELAVGLWLIRLGPKRTITYLVLVLWVAFMSSIFLYGAVRA